MSPGRRVFRFVAARGMLLHGRKNPSGRPASCASIPLPSHLHIVIQRVLAKVNPGIDLNLKDMFVVEIDVLVSVRRNAGRQCLANGKLHKPSTS